MPDLYTLTAPKLYGIIHPIMADDDDSAHVLKEVYRYIWNKRHDFAAKPTMNNLIVLAKRFALDHKLAGETIPRLSGTSDLLYGESTLDLSDLSTSELSLLSQILSMSQNGNNGNLGEPLTTQALHARLMALMPKGSKS